MALSLVPLALACSSSSAPQTSSDGGVFDARSGVDAGADGSGRDAAKDTALSGKDVSSPPDAQSDGGGDAARTGVFVAVGTGGRHVRSIDDGVTWIDDGALPPDAGSGDFIGLRTAVFGNDEFVGLGWRAMTSPDGNTWTDRGLLSINQWIGSAVYAQGKYVGLGGYGLRATSPDGVVWTDHSIDTVAAHPGACLSYADVMGGRFVSCNDNGARHYSPDGVTWTASTGATSSLTNGIAFGNSLFVGMESLSVVVSADGGATWTAAPDLPSAGVAIRFAGGQFFIFGQDNVFTSPDGMTWTAHAVTGFDATTTVAYGDGTFVMLTGQGFIHSTDGLTWSAPVAIDNTTNPIGWLTFGTPSP